MAKLKMKAANPPGWSDTDVSALSDKADEPYALAWYLHGKGVKPGDTKGAEEATSASALGQLYRPVKESTVAKPGSLKWAVKFCEAKTGDVNEATREIPVYIISEGPGNQADKHFYTKEALQKSFQRFDGAKAYADHPSKIEEQSRPERSIRDVIGHYHSAEFVEVGGVGKIKAILKVNQGDAFQWVWDMLQEALAFADKFPDQDYVGISIAADGITAESERDGEAWNDVTEISRVVSADIVTQPAAGGKPLRESVPSLRESVKAILEGGNKKGGKPVNYAEALMKASEALKAVRAAVAKDPAHDKAYGPALDDVHSQMEAAHKSMAAEAEAKKKEGEAAPPAKAPDTAPDAEPKNEEETYAAESKRYASGKMSPQERVLFESWQGVRMAQKASAAKAVVEKKLAESGIPAQYHAELSMLMEGRTEPQMDALLVSRKALIESVSGTRIPGAGGKTPSGFTGGTKLQEALAGSGILKKEGK